MNFIEQIGKHAIWKPLEKWVSYLCGCDSTRFASKKLKLKIKIKMFNFEISFTALWLDALNMYHMYSNLNRRVNTCIGLATYPTRSRSWSTHNHCTDLGNFYDFRNIEIGCNRRQTLANQVGLVSLLTMHLVDILLRVDGHRLNVHLCACSEHTDGNLSCNNLQSQRQRVKYTDTTNCRVQGRGGGV